MTVTVIYSLGHGLHIFTAIHRSSVPLSVEMYKMSINFRLTYVKYYFLPSVLWHWMWMKASYTVKTVSLVSITVATCCCSTVKEWTLWTALMSHYDGTDEHHAHLPVFSQDSKCPPFKIIVVGLLHVHHWPNTINVHCTCTAAMMKTSSTTVCYYLLHYQLQFYHQTWVQR